MYRHNKITAACIGVVLLAFFSLSPLRLHAADIRILFLHHSTGEGVYYEGGVPDWIDKYNSGHGNAYQITERNYPDSPYDWANYPYDYWNLWINGACDSGNPSIECIDTLCRDYDVIIYKHCFPGAAIQEDTGTPQEGSQTKSLENYKLYYRALRDMMDSYPDTGFILWTLAPLHRLATTADEAERARQFVHWVQNDFLTEDGKGHPNIAVFDFWGIVAESGSNPARGKENCLKYDYEQSHFSSDSHPNTAANKAAGPEFARCIVNTADALFGSGAPDNETQDADNETGGGDQNADSCALEQALGGDDPRLNELRSFRDTVLHKTASGKALCRLYYRYEPLIGKALIRSKLLRISVRHSIDVSLPVLRRLTDR